MSDHHGRGRHDIYITERGIKDRKKLDNHLKVTSENVLQALLMYRLCPNVSKEDFTDLNILHNDSIDCKFVCSFNSFVL